MAVLRALMAIVVLAPVPGCGGGRLSELEKEHADLRAEYDDLQANVEALKREMVDAGMITEAQANARFEKPRAKAGKAKAGKTKAGAPSPERSALEIGHPSPTNERTADLPWTATRSGTADPLPDLPPPTRTEGACGWVFKVPVLAPISDFPLNRDGFGKSGPIVLIEDGRPLTAHASPAEFDETCSGAFRHAGHTILFSPTGTVDDATRRTYAIEPAADFPLPRGDDERPMYWVYPGTTATFAFEGSWDESWGPAHLSVAGRAVGTGAGSLTAPGVEESLPGGKVALTRPIDTAVDELTVEIASPPGGPWLLIDTLTIGNAENAVVITADAAWSAGG